MVLWRLLPRLNVAKEKIHAAQQNQLDKFRFVSFLNLKLGNQEQHSALRHHHQHHHHHHQHLLYHHHYYWASKKYRTLY